MSLSRLALPTFLSLSFAQTALAGIDGFFHIGTHILVQESADPILSFGKRSGHAHSISGGNGLNLALDYAGTQQSTCTTASVAQDKSNYWIPMVFFHHSNGSYLTINAADQGQTIYYDYKAADEPFPSGFRMIAGNAMARSKYTPLNAPPDALIHECLGGKQQIYDGFPTEPCPARVRASIHFPTCGWANRSIDSWDHFSHVAYKLPTGCPDTHPISYPELHYEVYYSNAGVGPLAWDHAFNTSQPMVYAMGDATGYGLHGDFFNGWDDTLKNAMNSCNGNGGDGYCALFNLTTDAEQLACRKQGASPDLGNNEDVYGPLTKLPGCNTITTTSEAAIAQSKQPCSDKDAPPPVLAKARRHKLSAIKQH